METTSQEYKIVKYNSDPTKIVDDHDSDVIYLTEINERRFDNIYDAIKFLSDCNSPITTAEELLNKKGKTKFLVPERNIRIGIKTLHNIDETFDSDSSDWG
jgi:hypothetical protein